MIDSTITTKGQTTVPVEVRERMQAPAGTRLTWTVLPDGSAVVRAKTRSVMELAGSLKPPRGKRVKLEEMNPFA